MSKKKSLEEVKAERPACDTEDGRHGPWVNYKGSGTRQCEECLYEEELVVDTEY